MPFNDASGSDVYRRDLRAGVTTLVSARTGADGRGNGDSRIASISADGTRVAFESAATDLTAADPLFILPLVTGALMFGQTKLTPTPADPQQKMMTVLMPVMFTVFSIFLPAGLTLYIMTNTILGMAQQFLMNRNKDKEPQAAVVPASRAKQPTPRPRR